MNKKDMKKILLLLPLLLISHIISADNASDARKMLDKTAAVVGRSGGAQASFTISGGKIGTQSGTLAVKGNKFCAQTANATMWYNGKTQWTYLKSSNEVNVSTPNTAKQQSMNPLTFLSLYKSGYTLSMKKDGKLCQVHMKAQNAKTSIQEVYVTVNSNGHPSKIRVLQGGKWMTIVISNFVAKNQPDSKFTFNSKDYPQAEVIDLR